MFKGIIYTAFNKKTKRYYVGQTVRAFKERISEHYLNAKSNIRNKFYNSLRKNPKETFEWSEVCFIYDCDRENLHKRLDELEIYFINRYNSFKNGYNSTSGGGGTSGWTPPEEWIERQKETHLGKKFSEEHKRNISLSQKGKILSETHLNNIRKAAKNRNCLKGNNPNAKKIAKVLNGKTIKIYDSIIEAAEDIIEYKGNAKTKAYSIRRALKSDNYSAYGFHWVKVKEANSSF